MDLRLSSRAAVITGAAGGIGRATARALADEGVLVGLVDVSPAVFDVGSELGDRVRAFRADLTSPEQVESAVATCAEALGGIDVLVLCAGISGPVGTALEDTAPADWERVFAVNVTGSFLALRAALPWLRRSDAASVIVVASDSAFVAAPGMVPYGASKAALLQFARAAAVELRAVGVRVNAVCPSIVDTPMSRGDLRRDAGFSDAAFPVQGADEVADQIVLLASPRTRPVNAAAWVSDFGVSAASGFPA